MSVWDLEMVSGQNLCESIGHSSRPVFYGTATVCIDVTDVVFLIGFL